MTDESTEKEQPESSDSGRSGGTLGAVRTTLGKRDSKGRPLAVYGILGIGVATLLALMLVVYLWSNDRDKLDQPICTTISAAQAQDQVRFGKVERLTLVYDEQVETASDSRWGPVQARLDYSDGSCGLLPQGIMNQPDVMMILGEVEFYNTTTESAQIEVGYNASATLGVELFVTPTAIPTETPPVTETPEATEIPVSTPEATPTVAPTESSTEAPATPKSSPAATPRLPAATPSASPTP